MRKSNRKPNANPMRVVAKLQFYIVTLVGHETPIRVRAVSKGDAYNKATAIFPGHRRPLSTSIEIERPKVSF